MDILRLELLAILRRHFEQDPKRFTTIPRSLMQTWTVRAAIATLRNDGYVEEHTRGVIRLRPQGYMKYQRDRLLGP